MFVRASHVMQLKALFTYCDLLNSENFVTTFTNNERTFLFLGTITLRKLRIDSLIHLGNAVANQDLQETPDSPIESEK